MRILTQPPTADAVAASAPTLVTDLARAQIERRELTTQGILHGPVRPPQGRLLRVLRRIARRAAERAFDRELRRQRPSASRIHRARRRRDAARLAHQRALGLL